MKGFICCLVLSFSVATAFSQKVYFMYLQSETDQPFFVRLDDKPVSSTSTGYLILSKLKDSTYTFIVGFPENKWPEQPFKISMSGKDHGFLLKNFGEKGWGLFDLESLAVHMAITGTSKSFKMEPVQVSEFTEILSRASDDPSLKERPVAIKKEEPVAIQPAVHKEEVVDKPVTLKKEPDPVPLKADTELVKQEKKENKPVDNPVVLQKEPDPVPVKQDAITKEAAKEETRTPVKEKEKSVSVPVTMPDAPVNNDPPSVAEVKPEPQKSVPDTYNASVVRKRSESSNVDGLGITYIDEYADGKKDTIRIMIPNSTRQAVTKTPQKEEKKFLDITAESKDVTEIKKPATADSIKNTKALPGNCSSLASETDFLKLRKKMAAETDDDGMVREAAKSFKTKCFTVVQLKNLSTLFLNDAGKYKFFDAAYLHVPDPDRFASLQSELKDEYYVNRFKAMLR
jgi:hypothetical protein